jgi:hypothetical protein
MSRPRKPTFYRTLDDKMPVAPPVADNAVALVTTNTAAQPPPHIPHQLRFSDLKARNIVTNWVTLRLWIENLGFPPGILAGPNTRLWSEPDVAAWLDSRPSAAKPAPLRRARDAR